MEVDAPVPVGIQMTSATQFQSNDIFQHNNTIYNDANFTKQNRDTAFRNDRRNHEIITTLLSTHGENSDERIEKLLNEEISYRDLASLTVADFELIGFKDSNEREELISFCCQLPNQNPTYANLCNNKDANKYNEKILNKANIHLETMRAALSASNYKLKFMPPEDVIVGEKSFASRFVLESLTELNAVTYDIDKELKYLEEFVNKELNSNSMKAILDKTFKDNLKKSTSKSFYFSIFAKWILITSIASGTMALILWKLKK